MPLKNAQYDTLMREYNRRQLMHENERIAHQKEVYAAVPRIREIDETVSSLSAAQAKRAIRGEAFSIEDFRRQLASLKEEKSALLTQHGFSKDYLELTYTCPNCHDTGYANGQRCACYLQAATDLLYKQSGLAKILRKENFDTLSYAYYSRDPQFTKGGRTVYDNMDYIIRACHRYVQDFPTEKGNLLFTGSAGCGKTFLSHCIAKALMDQYYSVVYVTAPQMFDMFAKERFERDEESDTDVSQYILDCDLLILDDLGSEHSNSFTHSKFFSCISERQAREKGTIISTNLSLERIRDTYSDRIYSRLLGSYQCFNFYGPDIRILKRYKN
jgi:DNA replication protein DnaC